MAIVKSFKKRNIENLAEHTEVDATYSIIIINDVKYLQIDTYGSSERKLQGKVSQSLRLSESSLSELLRIIRDEVGIRE